MSAPPAVRATVIYAIAASLLAFVVSIVTTYIPNWHDAKFPDGSEAAFQVEFVGLRVFVIVASAVFAVAFHLLPGANAPRAAWKIVLAGAIYPVAMLLLGPVLGGTDPESWINPAVGWSYAIAYPLVAAYLVRL